MKRNKSWEKSFFKIYIGQAFSILSSSAVQFSIIWWITMETGSALALTIASVVGLLPQAVIGLFPGVWIDRFDRKKIMIIADAVVALSSLFLGLLFSIDIKSILFVYIVLFIRALGETFHKPALQAVIPQLVPSAELTKAGGFGQMINSACSMVGPMLGALLMSIATLQYPIYFLHSKNRSNRKPWESYFSCYKCYGFRSTCGNVHCRTRIRNHRRKQLDDLCRLHYGFCRLPKLFSDQRIKVPYT